MFTVAGLATTVLKALNLPLGASRERGGNVVNKSTNSYKQTSLNKRTSLYISSMVNITCNDICINDNPIVIKSNKDNNSEALENFIQAFTNSINRVITWIAKDLCFDGYSVFNFKTKLMGGVTYLQFIPVMDEVTLYLNDTMEIMAYNSNGEKLTDAIVFANFDNSNIVPYEADEEDKIMRALFVISPRPMQVTDAVIDTINRIKLIENAILQDRLINSKRVRFASVDIGTTLQDKIQDTVDTISSAINANSIDFDALSSDALSFQDDIPVLTHSGNVGEVSIVESLAQTNQIILDDLQENINKLCLEMNFPANYINFSQGNSITATNVIKQDIRYNRMITNIQSLITRTIKEFLDVNFFDYDLSVDMASVPSYDQASTLEAIDATLTTFQSINTAIESDTIEGRLHKLSQLNNLLSSSTTNNDLKRYIEDEKKYIEEVLSKQQNVSDTLNDVKLDFE